MLDEPTALALTRAIGRSVDRLASWQVQLLGESYADSAEAAGDSGETSAQTVAGAAQQVSALSPTIADAFEPLIAYAWRRHPFLATCCFVTETAPDTRCRCCAARSASPTWFPSPAWSVDCPNAN